MSQVTPIHGERMRYMVRSENNHNFSYIVDLTENGGNGACGCPDFVLRKTKNLKEGRPSSRLPRPVSISANATRISWRPRFQP